ncbi:hypothetical protein GOODEAATRI_002120 [Goodea atripinnis]|uniref:Uncharacterized protein n=1 Tax=Goodea atripinnis TaxID=208336 RepID=A0ABV0PK18_9TELE
MIFNPNQAKTISLKARRASLMIEQGLQMQEEPKCPSQFVSVSPRHSCPSLLVARPCPRCTHSVLPGKHQVTSASSFTIMSHNMANISGDIQQFSARARASSWLSLPVTVPSLCLCVLTQHVAPTPPAVPTPLI